MSRQRFDSLHRRLRSSLLFAVGFLLPVATAAQSSDGLLGIYFDRDAQRCTGSVSSGSSTTMYVVLVGEGATSGGITGAEFSIETTGAQSYFFHGETGFGNVQLGSAFSGVNIVFSACQSARVVPLMSFQVLNPGGAAADATLRVTKKPMPSNTSFQCAIAVLCDAVYSTVCVEGGKAVLNPAAERPCGSSREVAEWTRIKELYKP